jgi:hypothetical protein
VDYAGAFLFFVIAKEPQAPTVKREAEEDWGA